MKNVKIFVEIDFPIAEKILEENREFAEKNLGKSYEKAVEEQVEESIRDMVEEDATIFVRTEVLDSEDSSTEE